MHPCHPPRPRPPRPAPPEGFLVQKIIACEKRHLPCVYQEWCFDACANGSIQSVSACGAPVWTIPDGGRLCIRLPLCVRLCDPCGHASVLSASAEVETDLPRSFACWLEDPRNTLLILPCVRLMHAECLCSGRYRAQLAISLDLYLLRYEAMRCSSPAPACPQLPLYPPPVF